MSTHQDSESTAVIVGLEERIGALEKTNAALMRRVEKSVDSAGEAYSIFETNILLQAKVNERTEELEKANEELRDQVSLNLETQKALSENAEKYEAIVNSAQAAIIMIDDTGCARSWNPAAVTIFGWTRAEMIGKNLFETLVPAKYRESYRAQDTELLQAAKASVVFPRREIQAQRRDGLEITLELSMSRVHLQDRWYSLWILRDITESKLAEEKLKSHSESLRLAKEHQERSATRLKHLVSELELAKAGAEAANDAKSRFLANMSHEIRTPMNAIIGMTHLALRTELDAKQRRYLNNVLQSANALLRLINDILDLSKIEAGRVELEEAEFELDKLLNSLAAQFAPKAMEKNLDLVFLPFTNSGRAFVGDELRVDQILINLLGNAIKFTEHGEVVLGIEEVERSATSCLLQFNISDTGIGIAQERLSELSQPFVQADASTARQYGGTGLGLSISKRLAEMMGGRLWIESELGKGSTFRFTVELRLGRELNRSIEHSSEGIRGMRVLIVSSQAQHRQKISELLFSLTFAPTCLSTLEEAKSFVLSSIEHQKASLLIVDQGLERDKTEDLTHLIRTLKESGSTIKTMVLRHEAFEKYSEPDHELWDAIMYKPITASLLIDEIQQVFAGTRKLKEPCEQIANACGRLAEVKILLTEDNKINQDVAVELLSSEGAIVEVANDGQEALTFLSKRKFDVVLMDIQMPGLDGYETTRLIRTNPDFSELPVLAMTANAMSGDREKSLKAGMNGHIAKPIDPEILVSTILQWAKVTNQAANKNSPAAGDVNLAAVSSLIDSLKSFDVPTAVRRMGCNTKAFSKLLSKSLQSLRENFELLTRSLKSDDLESALRAAHTLKGLGGNIGALKIYDSANRTENALRDGKKLEDDLFLQSLRDSIETATMEIERLQQNTPPTDEPPVNVQANESEIGNIIARLAHLLKEKDADAVEVMEELQNSCGSSIKALKLADLESAVSRYQFTQAQKILEEIANERNLKQEEVHSGL
jgi:PAS domain S-box-containing protein